VAAANKRCQLQGQRECVCLGKEILISKPLENQALSVVEWVSSQSAARSPRSYSNSVNCSRLLATPEPPQGSPSRTRNIQSLCNHGMPCSRGVLQHALQLCNHGMPCSCAMLCNHGMPCSRGILLNNGMPCSCGMPCNHSMPCSRGMHVCMQSDEKAVLFLHFFDGLFVSVDAAAAAVAGAAGLLLFMFHGRTSSLKTVQERAVL